MDTMLQHARMYGYRRELMSFTRVFLPASLALRFHGIHVAEAALRDQFRCKPGSARVPVQVVADMRATRLGVLDASSVNAFRPGEHLYPVVPVHETSKAGPTERRITGLIAQATGRADTRHNFTEISISDMCRLIEAVPVDSADEHRWDTKGIVQVLRSLVSRYENGYLMVRPMERQPKVARLLTGAASGEEKSKTEGLGKPVLMLFRESGVDRPWSGTPFYYPSLVFPLDMPNQVFNSSDM